VNLSYPLYVKHRTNRKAAIYDRFGSVVVEDAQAMTSTLQFANFLGNQLTRSYTETIFSAISKSGVRALVSAGWGGIGGVSVPPNVFILGNVPHDWLFGKVSAVCHHGGAGTTAIGLFMGKPTIVVPFFGDQPFWGALNKRVRTDDANYFHFYEYR